MDCLSEENKNKAGKIYANHFSGYAQKTNDQSRSDIEQLILESKFEEARNYLIDNQSQFQEAEFNKLQNEVLVLEATNKDGLITHELFVAFQDTIETNLQKVNKASPTGSPLVSPALGITFKKEMAQWLKDNPSENYPTASAREKAFLQEVKNRSQDYLSVIAQNETQVPVSVPPDNQQGGTGTNKEVFDPNKLDNKEPVLASEGSEVQVKF